MLHPLNKLENPLQGFSKCFTIHHFKAGCSEVYREMRLNVTFFAYLIKKKKGLSSIFCIVIYCWGMRSPSESVCYFLYLSDGLNWLSCDAAAAAVICLSALERYCLSEALFWLKLQLSSPSKSCNRKQKPNENWTEARKLTVVAFLCCFLLFRILLISLNHWLAASTIIALHARKQLTV